MMVDFMWDITSKMYNLNPGAVQDSIFIKCWYRPRVPFHGTALSGKKCSTGLVGLGGLPFFVLIKRWAIIWQIINIKHLDI